MKSMDVYLAESKERRKRFISIKFQQGPVDDVGENGCHIEDVIDLLIERLRGFNEGELRCRENSLAITALEEAGLWLMKRRLNRIEQGVEGSLLPHKS